MYVPYGRTRGGSQTHEAHILPSTFFILKERQGLNISEQIAGDS